MRPSRFQHFLLPIFILMLASCANYKYNVATEVSDWEKKQPDPSLKLSHTMYLVGDAGNAKLGKSTPTLKYLKNKISRKLS